MCKVAITLGVSTRFYLCINSSLYSILYLRYSTPLSSWHLPNLQPDCPTEPGFLFRRSQNEVKELGSWKEVRSTAELTLPACSCGSSTFIDQVRLLHRESIRLQHSEAVFLIQGSHIVQRHALATCSVFSLRNTLSSRALSMSHVPGLGLTIVPSIQTVRTTLHVI